MLYSADNSTFMNSVDCLVLKTSDHVRSTSTRGPMVVVPRVLLTIYINWWQMHVQTPCCSCVRYLDFLKFYLWYHRASKQLHVLFCCFLTLSAPLKAQSRSSSRSCGWSFLNSSPLSPVLPCLLDVRSGAGIQMFCLQTFLKQFVYLGLV